MYSTRAWRRISVRLLRAWRGRSPGKPRRPYVFTRPGFAKNPGGRPMQGHVQVRPRAPQGAHVAR